ncbi:hypothetical protein DNH61_02390 [Paenibacillus sambharensis]|uniref:HEAT repeat domain-containing protein n=1 Tax=Paenibacillus sambharensis TaxID=1803190 RepID=A0A2W1LR76_9BACL|nr:hypothetical protein [Paenibacillus sambharensis]PZD97462.1 hypothetical protein DNH61_02390 [Paenibacillus sambharensis]
MSMEMLYDLHQDVRRLFIAGSAVSGGDVRIKRQLPKLEQLGESAPVFKRVAEAASRVGEGTAEQMADALLELAVLLHAILYTQGQTDAAGTLEPFEVYTAASDTTAAPPVPYRRLKPVIDALTERGPGRLEAVKQGYEDNIFTDIRTYLPAVTALEDPYSEIADYMTNVVLPSMGANVLPILHAQLNLQGGQADARKLTVIHRLTGQASHALIAKALTEGAAPVKLAAIAAAAGSPDLEELLYEISYDRKKEIRAAALLALAKNGSDRAAERLFEALQGKDAEIAVEPLRRCDHPDTGQRLVETASELRDMVTGGKPDNAAIERMTAAVNAMEGKREPAVEEFLISLLQDQTFTVKETEPVQECAAGLLLEMDTAAAYEVLNGLRNRINMLDYAFRAALQFLPREAVYDHYHGYLAKKQSAEGKTLLRACHDIVIPVIRAMRSYTIEEDYGQLPQHGWDSRWVQLFVKLDEAELVCSVAERLDEHVIDYLLAKLHKPRTRISDQMIIVSTLFRLGHRDASELLLYVLEQASPQQFYYVTEELRALILQLPGTAADRLRAAAERFTYTSVKEEIQDLADKLALKPTE